MPVVRSARQSSASAVVAVITAVVALVLGLTVATPATAAPATRSRLDTGETLTAGRSLVSAGGDYRLVLQGDGNLVLYGPGRTLWSTRTAGSGKDDRLVLQGDGNLVLYDGTGHALWNTHTRDGRSLVVQDDANLVLYGGTAKVSRVSWTSGTPGPTLGPGESLRAGESMRSTDGRYRLTLTAAGGLVLTGPGRTLWSVATTAAAPRLVMQGDGNLVLYDGAHAVWATNTAARAGTVASVAAGRLTVSRAGVDLWHSPSPPSRLAPKTWLLPGERIVSPTGAYALVMQGDGDLVLYGPSGVGWTTRTTGTPRGLVLQADGNLVLYRSTGVAWASGTNTGTPAFLQIQDDGHLVLYAASGRPVWAVWARSTGLAASVAAAAAFGRANGERTAVAVLDRATGLLYTAGDVNAAYPSASLVKVFIAARLLSQGAAADPTLAGRLYRMITMSDDAIATQLWPRAGGAGVTDWVQARYGITGLGHPSQAGWWGLTQITATAMVRFYAAIKNDPAVGPFLTNAMAHAAQFGADGWNQWFGIPSATSGWKVKQGWMCCLEGRSRLHSTGFLSGDRYTAAILTDGGTGYYGQRGADVVTGAAVRLLPGRKVPA